MYRVTYITPTRPTDLPEGAEVEQMKTEFPHVWNSGIQRQIQVSKIGDGIYLEVTELDDSRHPVCLWAPKDKTRELAHLLLEAIGEGVDELVTPELILDGEGDHWVGLDNGRYACTGSSTELSHYQDDFTGCTLAGISDAYNGFTVIR